MVKYSTAVGRFRAITADLDRVAGFEEDFRDLYERNGWVLVPGETIEELGVVEVRYRCIL